MQLERGAALGIVGGIRVIGIRGERNLGVDHQISPAGKQNNHVGACRFRFSAVLALEAGETLLKTILFAFVQPGFLQQIAQNKLAPVALSLGRAAQGGAQVLCFFGKLLVHAAQIPDQAFELGHAGFRIALRLLHLLAEFFDLRFERLKQRA